MRWRAVRTISAVGFCTLVSMSMGAGLAAETGYRCGTLGPRSVYYTEPSTPIEELAFFALVAVFPLAVLVGIWAKKRSSKKPTDDISANNQPSRAAYTLCIYAVTLVPPMFTSNSMSNARIYLRACGEEFYDTSRFVQGFVPSVIVTLGCAALVGFLSYKREGKPSKVRLPNWSHVWARLRTELRPQGHL